MGARELNSGDVPELAIDALTAGCSAPTVAVLAGAERIWQVWGFDKEDDSVIWPQIEPFASAALLTEAEAMDPAEAGERIVTEARALLARGGLRI